MVAARTALFGFDPLAEMQRMQQEMNRLFTGLSSGSAREFPPVNLWIGEHSLVATAELPGVPQSDIDLSIREDTLTISGRRPAPAEDGASWHRRECSYGEFSRTIELPFRIDPERVQARLANGLLEIELQRPEAERPKKIAITSA